MVQSVQGTQLQAVDNTRAGVVASMHSVLQTALECFAAIAPSIAPLKQQLTCSRRTSQSAGCAACAPLHSGHPNRHRCCTLSLVRQPAWPPWPLQPLPLALLQPMQLQ